MSDTSGKETTSNITSETTFAGGTHANADSADLMMGAATPDMPKSIKDLRELSPRQINYLQRTIGNSALMHMMDGASNSADTRNFAASFKMGGRTTPLQRTSAAPGNRLQSSHDKGNDYAPVDDIEIETFGIGESVEHQSIDTPPPNDEDGSDDGDLPPMDALGSGEGEKNNPDIQRYANGTYSEQTDSYDSSEYSLEQTPTQSHSMRQMKRESKSPMVYPTVTFSDGKQLFLKPNEYSVVQRTGEKKGGDVSELLNPFDPYYILPNKSYQKWKGDKKDPSKGTWVPARKSGTALEITNFTSKGNDYEGEVAGTKVKVSKDFVQELDKNQKEIVDNAKIAKDPTMAKAHRGSSRYILPNKPFEFWEKDKSKKKKGQWVSASIEKTSRKINSPKKNKGYYEGRSGGVKVRAKIGDTAGGKSGGQSIVANRPLFDKTTKPPQPKPDDVFQNELGDCYLLAAMSALASTTSGKAQLENMMVDQGTAVSVRLYQKRPGGRYTPRYVTVNKSEAKNPAGDKLYATGALWVIMLEKAYASAGFTGEGNRSGGRASMQDIHGGWSYEAMGVLTGKKAEGKDIAGGLERIESGKNKGSFKDPFTGKAVSSDSIPWHKKHRTEYINMMSKPKKLQQLASLSLYTYFQSDENATKEWGKHLKSNYKDFDKIFKARRKDIKGNYAHQITVDDFKPTLNKVTNALAKTTVTKTVEKWYPGKIGTGKYSDPQEAIFTQIQNSLTAGNAVTASTYQYPAKKKSKSKGKSGGEEKVAGLAGGHEYTILQVLSGTDNARKPSKTADYRWIKVRNPWGNYRRDYDFSTAIGTAAAKEMVKSKSDPDNGTFWIELSDFTRHFFKVSTSG